MRDALRVAAERSVLLRCGSRTTSGWLLDGYLVAPGLLLSPNQAEEIEAASDPSDTSVPKISVILRRGTSEPADAVVEAVGRVVAVWRSEDLQAGLGGILDEWKLAREDPEDDEQQERGAALEISEVRQLLSLFLLLRLQIPNAIGEEPVAREVLSEALRRTPEVPPRGVSLCLACAPLGAPALLGAISQGVVSGVSPGGLLMLTDARAAPGSEGAPVYSLSETVLAPVALVLSPLSWWRGEAVGFTLCVPLRRVLAGALVSRPAPSPLPLSSLLPAHRDRQDLMGLIDRSVLLVRCGHLWGSGILADKDSGVVLTCAHVVGPSAQTAAVRWGQHSAEADVVWRAPPGQPFDVALLKLRPNAHLHDLQPLPLDTSAPVVGETVFAVGYPLFSETQAPEGWRLRPLVSRGEVSGWWPSARTQVLTTCTVQSGASGGPLIRLSSSGDSASAIGLLVCTAQLGSGRDSVVYPNVNLALWIQAIVGPLRRYLDSGDLSSLDELRCGSSAIQKQWRLEPPTMSKL